jgi:hypothetical protein
MPPHACRVALLPYGILLAVLTLSRAVEATQPAAEFASDDEVDTWMKTYYQSPQPERIGAFIRSLGTVYTMTSPSADDAAAAFLSEVFRANPKRTDSWRKSAGPPDSRPATVVSLASSLANSKNGVIDVHELSAKTNDMYWGAFFGSGNRQYVDRLIQRLALCDMSRYPHKATNTVFDNKGDFDSFFAGCTAA